MSQNYTQETADASQIDDPSPLGIKPDSEFAMNTPVYDHTDANTLVSVMDVYESDPDNGVTLGDTEWKAAAAFEVIQKSQAVLVESEPWFVNEHMQTPDFDRWEPFFVAFPEVADGRQMKFSNLAPLSEIAYRLQQRDEHLEKRETELDDNPDRTDHAVQAIIEEQKAFTRYTLDSCHTGPDDASPETRGERVDMSAINAIHTALTPWQHHLIIGSRDDGTLYCGRGSQFDKFVDVAIDLDRRVNEHGERKVAVYNDKRTKKALKSLDFDETHTRYLGPKQRWEVDISALKTVITGLLEHEDIQFVSVHRVTEKAFLAHVDNEFFYDIDGYPAFDE